MINFLKGILEEISPTNITVLVNGVGYSVSIPLSTFDNLPKIGSECKILTYLHVREDILQIYGFITHEERDLFKLLITISGIGPKMALTILSGISVENLKNAIATGDTQLLSKTPGIGKKTAQRIVIELKERVGGVVIKTTKPIQKEEDHLQAGPSSNETPLCATYHSKYLLHIVYCPLGTIARQWRHFSVSGPGV